MKDIEINYDLCFTPIGGVGQIGGNMSLFETNNTGIIIDSGTLFPRDKVLGINYLIPDYSDVDFTKFNHILITHSHEDHIGGLDLLLKRAPHLKIYASPYTSIVIKNKLKRSIDIQVIHHLETLNIGDFEIIPFEVDHSTADTFGFYLKANSQSIIFASDFKCHKDSENTLSALKKISNVSKGSNHFLSLLDSTSVRSTGFTTREIEVRPDLKKLLSRNKRSLLTMFSSNIHRLKTICEIAKEIDKKVLLYGRSMHFSFKCAVEARILKPSHAEDIEDYPNITKEHIVLASGCQGNFRSTLKNISKGVSKFFQIEKNDQVIFSSSIIPGNEKEIQGVYNAFVEQGADILTYKDYKIHCSGHAAQEDLKLLIKNLPITHHVPIHGETFLLKKNFEFISEQFKSITTKWIRDFDTLYLKNTELYIKDNPPKKPLLINYAKNEIPRSIISQRRKIAENGIAVVNIDTLKFSVYGVSLEDDLINRVESSINKKFSRQRDTEDLRVFTRQLLHKILGYRPVVIVN